MIDVNKCPVNIIFAPGDKIAYVANWSDNNVAVVDIFSHRQTKSIR
jgi:DNA-binding beta-propeller fold protein YncE